MTAQKTAAIRVTLAQQPDVALMAVTYALAKDAFCNYASTSPSVSVRSHPWLLTELNDDDPDRDFGLCELGMGRPELGHGRLSALAALRDPGNLRVERDRARATKSLSAYTVEARPTAAS